MLGLGLAFSRWTATSPLAFPRFLVVAALVLYLPGHALLRPLKLRALDRFTLSLLVGTLASTLVYGVMARLGARGLFPIWPAATGLLLLAARVGRRRAGRVRPGVVPGRVQILLVLLVVTGWVCLAAHPLYYRNLALEGDSMSLYGLHDLFFHLSLSHELAHFLPAQVPFIPGTPLRYHFGMDLLGAMMSDVGGLGVPDLGVRFLPSLLLPLTLLSVFGFARSRLGRPWAALLVALLVCFGEDLAFVPGLLTHDPGPWAVDFFGTPTATSIFQLNPTLPALAILFGALACIHRYLRGGRMAWLGLAVFLSGCLVECKAFTAAQLALALAVAGGLRFLARREKRLLVVALAVGATVTIAFLASVGPSTGRAEVAVRAWPYVPQFLIRSGLLGTWIGRGSFAFLQTGSVVGALVFFGIAVPLYLVGSFGTRALAFLPGVRSLARPGAGSSIDSLLGAFVVSGPALGLTVTITAAGYAARHAYNNSVWFMVQSEYVASVPAVVVLIALLRRQRTVGRWLSVTAFLVLSLVGTAQLLRFTMSDSLARLPDGWLRVARYVAQKLPPGSVALAPAPAADVLLALTACRVPALQIFPEYALSPTQLARRRAELDRFWTDWGAGRLDAAAVERYDAGYVVAPAPVGGPPAGVERLFESGSLGVFRILRGGSEALNAARTGPPPPPGPAPALPAGDAEAAEAGSGPLAR